MEETKWLKPSDSVSRTGDSASVQAPTRVNAEQASKRTSCGADLAVVRGRRIRLGTSEDEPTRRHRGSGGSMYKGKRRNTGSPIAWAWIVNRKPARDRPGAWGGGEARSTDEAG